MSEMPTTIPINEAASTLRQTEAEVKRACQEELHKPGDVDIVMLTRAELERLQAYFQDRKASSRPGMGGQGRMAGRTPRQPPNKSRNAGVVIEQRKHRGRVSRTEKSVNRLHKEEEVQQAAVVPPPIEPQPPQEQLVKEPVKEKKEQKEEQENVAVIRQSNASQSFHDKFEAHRNLEQVKKEKEAKPPKEEAKQEVKEEVVEKDENPQRLGPKPIGTISITDAQVKKRERRVRKPRKFTKSTDLRKQDFVMPQRPKVFTVDVPEEIPLKQLAYLMSVKTSQVMEKLAEIVDIEDEEQPEMLDQETAMLIVEEFGHSPRKVFENKTADFVVKKREAAGSEMIIRPPVVTVMGHVDHGKTSLLDFIRKSQVTKTESGGITQHIGAYQVDTEGGKITFIDTPGHEVFTEMRARGASVTDIVILVVAADDGVQPQTKEAIAHARSAEVPIVVAINKIDLPGATPDEVIQQLAGLGIQSEGWGGDVIMIPVSAETGEGVDKLLESVLLTSEMLELSVPVDVDAHGSIIEAKTEKGLGSVVSVIVKAGVLNKGDFILCDTEYGRVRAMRDEEGKEIKEALPAMPAQIQGIANLPRVGSEFFVAKEEQSARAYAEEQRYLHRQRDLAKKRTVIEASDLDELFAITEAMEESKVLNLVVKTDVAGTCEAMEKALVKIGNKEAKLKIIHSGVGAVSESDAMLANASDAMIVGFRVTANPKARGIIQDRKLPSFYSDVFYEVTDHLKERLLGMLEPTQEEHLRGAARVKEVFHINKIGKIAGCAVEEGSIERNLPVRVVRDGTIVSKTSVSELRHYKESVGRVAAGSDCGISLDRFADFKPGDVIESYEVSITAKTF